MSTSGQPLPVRLYQTASRIMLAAPMPGLEPEDIAVRIDARHVTIHGEERGQHQREIKLAIAEWSIGPYHREIDLGESVDGVLTNATYGNGVLVLSMPKASAGHRESSVAFRLVTVADGRGERVGHVGHAAAPQTTEAHRAEKHAATASRPGPGRAVGPGQGPYAHLNVWRLNEAGATWDDTTAREVAARLAAHPGFRFYALIRTQEREVVAVTVFESREQLETALAAVGPIVETRVKPLTASPPERRAGAVLYHTAT
jgi:HSP20 family protein